MRYTFNELQEGQELTIKECLTLNGWAFKAGYKIVVLKNITNDYLELGIKNEHGDIIATELMGKNQTLEIKTIDRILQTVTID